MRNTDGLFSCNKSHQQRTMSEESAHVPSTRPRPVVFSKAEIISILKKYQLHPTSWKTVLAAMQEDIGLFPFDARQLYQTAAVKQLQRRISKKLNNLMAAATILDPDIRIEIQRIKGHERRLLTRYPRMNNDDDGLEDSRDSVNGQISSSTHEPDNAAMPTCQSDNTMSQPRQESFTGSNCVTFPTSRNNRTRVTHTVQTPLVATTYVSVAQQCWESSSVNRTGNTLPIYSVSDSSNEVVANPVSALCSVNTNRTICTTSYLSITSPSLFTNSCNSSHSVTIPYSNQGTAFGVPPHTSMIGNSVQQSGFHSLTDSETRHSESGTWTGLGARRYNEYHSDSNIRPDVSSYGSNRKRHPVGLLDLDIPVLPRSSNTSRPSNTLLTDVRSDTSANRRSRSRSKHTGGRNACNNGCHSDSNIRPNLSSHGSDRQRHPIGPLDFDIPVLPRSSNTSRPSNTLLTDVRSDTSASSRSRSRSTHTGGINACNNGGHSDSYVPPDLSSHGSNRQRHPVGPLDFDMPVLPRSSNTSRPSNTLLTDVRSDTSASSRSRSRSTHTGGINACNNGGHSDSYVPPDLSSHGSNRQRHPVGPLDFNIPVLPRSSNTSRPSNTLLTDVRSDTSASSRSRSRSTHTGGINACNNGGHSDSYVPPDLSSHGSNRQRHPVGPLDFNIPVLPRSSNTSRPSNTLLTDVRSDTSASSRSRSRSTHTGGINACNNGGHSDSYVPPDLSSHGSNRQRHPVGPLDFNIPVLPRSSNTSRPSNTLLTDVRSDTSASSRSRSRSTHTGGINACNNGGHSDSYVPPDLSSHGSNRQRHPVGPLDFNIPVLPRSSNTSRPSNTLLTDVRSDTSANRRRRYSPTHTGITRSVTNRHRDQVPRTSTGRRLPDSGRVRDAIASNLSSDDNDNSDGGAPRVDRPNRRKMAELIRENHEMYNHFMRNDLPRIYRQFGLDSD